MKLIVKFISFFLLVEVDVKYFNYSMKKYFYTSSRIDNAVKAQ